MTTGTSVSGKSILLVDDDPGVREAIKLLLNIDLHTVTEAANGREAMQFFNRSTFDLVITDYLMPEMLGDELAQTIKNRTPAQPVLMVTAHLEELGAACQSVDAVLGKPLSLDDLRRAMAIPALGAFSPDAAASGSVSGFNFAGLATRAAVTTSVLDEILRRKRPSRSVPDWKSNL